MRKLLTTTEAAHFLGVSAEFLRKDRQKLEPRFPWLAVGTRTVKYDLLTLEKRLLAFTRG